MKSCNAKYEGSVLHVAPFSPVSPDSGGRVRLAATVESLSKGWDVRGIYFEEHSSRLMEARRVLPPATRVLKASAMTHFRSSHNKWLDRLLRGIHLLALGVRIPTRPAQRWPGLDDTFAALASDVDVALIEFGQLADWKPRSIPSVVVAYDLNWEKQLERSRFVRRNGRRNWPEATRLRLEATQIETLEARAYAQHDVVVVVSEADRQTLMKTWAKHDIPQKPVVVSPNGVDLSRVMEIDTPAKQGTALFVGGLDHPPNLDAVSALATSIVPASGPALRRLLLVGAGTEHIRGTRIHGLGRVDSLGEHYASSAITVAPIRWGSGTRLKILESLAHARPVVAFPEAAEGLDDLVRSGAIIIVDDDLAFARAVDNLLGEPDIACALGIAGRDAVMDYDWSMTLLPIEDAMRHAVSMCTKRT